MSKPFTTIQLCLLAVRRRQSLANERGHLRTDNVTSSPPFLAKYASITFVSVLVCGSDPVLLWTREMLSRESKSHGFFFSNSSDAERMLLSHTVSSLILCYTLSSEKREAAVEFAECKKPPVRALMITAGGAPSIVREHDAVLSALDGPWKLMETVQNILQSVRGTSVGSFSPNRCD